VGETINANAIFSVAASALPTGTYGQEAVFTLDPTQRNASGYTIGSIIRSAKEVEDTIWNTEEGLLQHRKAIAKVKAIYKPRSERNGSGVTGETTEGNTGSTRGTENQQRIDEEETSPTGHRLPSQNGSRSRGSNNTPLPIASTSSSTL